MGPAIIKAQNDGHDVRRPLSCNDDDDDEWICRARRK